MRIYSRRREWQFWQVAIVSIAVIVIDVGSKWIVRFLGLRIMENPYGPFSLFPISVVIPISIIALCGVCVLFRGNISKMERAGMALVIGGGVSNVGERILYGHVSDIFFIHRAAWNIADMVIIAGALLVGISLIHAAIRHER